METAHDVAADRTGRVAVARMVHRTDDGLLETPAVPDCAVDGDGQRFVACPAAADGFDGLDVRDVRTGQVQGLFDEIPLRGDVRRPEFPIGLSPVLLRFDFRQKSRTFFDDAGQCRIPIGLAVQDQGQDVVEDGRREEA